MRQNDKVKIRVLMESVCMPVIDRKFSPEALRSIQGPQATFYILLSKLL